MIKRLLNFIFGEGDCTFQGNIVGDSNICDNISEPVISFVKCFEENPKRFKLSSEWYMVQSSINETQTYFLEDKVTGIKYKYSYYPLADEPTDHIDIKDLLTKDEITYLIDVLKEGFKARQTRYNQILEQRKQRTQNRLREKLTKVYQEG